nr:MAG TPA: hypothetical protein [Bacteriophage sp.]
MTVTYNVIYTRLSPVLGLLRHRQFLYRKLIDIFHS